jgi:hypothetical protein
MRGAQGLNKSDFTWLIQNCNYTFQLIAMPHTQHPIELLRFNTCGSVDDGKSTPEGRRGDAALTET